MTFPKPKLACNETPDPLPGAPAAQPRPYTPLVILIITAVAVAVPFLFIAQGKDIINWRTDLAAALAEAKAANKPVLVDFTADWCPPCRTMKRNVFSKETVKTFIEQRFIPVRIDVTHRTAAHDELGQQFRIQYMPTYLVLSAAGEEKSRESGALSEADFITWLTQATQ